MRSEFIRLNTVFKPPENVVKKAIALSNKISKSKEAFFILDGIHFHPHITIYSPEYPKENLDNVLEKVEKFVDNTEKVNLSLNGISSGQGSIILNFDYTPELKKIHEQIVRKLNPLREGHIREKYDADDYKMRLNQEQQKNIKKYGYPDSMSLYSPHLTIIKLKDALLARELSKILKWDIPEFTVDKIAIYEMGEHGTCKKLIREFSLR